MGKDDGSGDERRVAGADSETDGDRIEEPLLAEVPGVGLAAVDHRAAIWIKKNTERSWLKYLESVSYGFHTPLESS